MSNLSEKYFKPAQLKPRIKNGKLEIIILDGGMGYLGDVKIEVQNRLHQLPETKAEFVANIENGSITGVLVPDENEINSFTEYLESPNNGGSGYRAIPTITITPDQNKLDLKEFSPKELRRRPLAFFTDSLDNLEDTPNAPTGAKVTLNTDAFDITWDDLDFPWDDLYHNFREAELQVVLNQTDGSIQEIEIIDGGTGYISKPTISFVNTYSTNYIRQADVEVELTNGSITGIIYNDYGLGYQVPPDIQISGGIPTSNIHTWETLGWGNYYEMEWIVKGPRKFQYNKRGRVDDLKQHDVILPFVGIYDVELKLYDTANTVNNIYKPEFLEVVIPNVSFGGFYRHLDILNSWDDLTKPWDQLIGTWTKLMYQNQNIDQMTLNWEDYKIENYYNIDIDNVKRSKPVQILEINETDLVLGTIDKIVDNKIILKNSKVNPYIQDGEMLYFQLDGTIFNDYASGDTKIYYIKGIEAVVPDEYDSNMYNTYGLILNYETNQYENGESVPTYIVENPESYEDYEEPEIIITPIGTLDLNLLEITTQQEFYVFSDSMNIPNNTFQSILENEILDSEIDTQTNRYFLKFWVTDNDGNKQRLKVEIDKTQISYDVSLTGKYAIIPINIGAPILPDTGFDPNAKYSRPPNISGFITATITNYTNSPEDYTVTFLEELNDIYNINIKSRIICKYKDSTYSIINKGAWIQNPPVFLEQNLDHRVIGVLDISEVETSIEVQNTETINRLSEGWNILRKIGKTVLLEGNLENLKNGDWLDIQPDKNYQKIEKIQISGFGDRDYPSLILNRNFHNIDNQKIEIYRLLEWNGVEILSVDTVNNTLSLNFESDATELLEKLNLSSLNEILLENNRFMVLRATGGNSNNIINLEIRAIDNPLEWLNNNYTFISVEFKWYRFVSKIYETINTTNTTELILELNFWTSPYDFNLKILEYLNTNPREELEDWYFDVNILNGTANVKVISTGLLNGNTIVNVEDNKNELWNCGVKSLAYIQSFNTETINTRLGLNKITWDSMGDNNITWKDLEYFSWDMFNYTHAKIPVFRITKVEQGGKIQWNEEPVFEFTSIFNDENTVNILTNEEKLKLAVKELNTTYNSGMNRFNFLLDDENIPTQIIASAKTPGTDALGSIKFEDGTEGEYQFDVTQSHSFPEYTMAETEMLNGSFGVINQKPSWDFMTQTYLQAKNPIGEWGWYPKEYIPLIYRSESESWRSDRIPYIPAVAGDIAMNEIRLFEKNWIRIPRLTTVFFAPISNIKGKVKYIWEINTDTDNIITYYGRNLVWNFIDIGKYNIKLTIIDNKGNSKYKNRNGIIQVVQEI